MINFSYQKCAKTSTLLKVPKIDFFMGNMTFFVHQIVSNLLFDRNTIILQITFTGPNIEGMLQVFLRLQN